MCRERTPCARLPREALAARWATNGEEPNEGTGWQAGLRQQSDQGPQCRLFLHSFIHSFTRAMSAECWPCPSRQRPGRHRSGGSERRLACITSLNLHLRCEVDGLLAHSTDEETEAWPASGSWTRNWGPPEAKLLWFPTGARALGAPAWGGQASLGSCPLAVWLGTALGL